MMVEQREKDEAFPKMVQRAESYMREQFSGGAAGKLDEGEVKDALVKAVSVWCLNRGLNVTPHEIKEAADEGYRRHMANWQGKAEGDDTRGNMLGRAGPAATHEQWGLRNVADSGKK